jgi:alanyl-tRNA synthetase
MLAKDLRRQFINFFVKKYGHAEIRSASLIPENDPTVLFTTAGMHPLVPYLLGEAHPAGKRLVDVQKSMRTDDIDDIGDDTHCTFFEMLGNWSLGDYFKKESIEMSYKFLTLPIAEGGLGLDSNRLVVTCFKGDNDAPKDQEGASYWEIYGFKNVDAAEDDSRKLIFFYGKKQNWWGPAGQTGPCGPDSEMYYDVCPQLPWYEHKPGINNSIYDKNKYYPDKNICHPDCDCKRYLEIWNNVFMQYNKQADGTFIPLEQKNVDTGMGLERLTSVMQGKTSHYETELFVPAIETLLTLAKNSEQLSEEEKIFSERIIVDHIRAATFILGDPWGVTPSNVDQGYVLRRLIRRAIRHGRKMGIVENFTHKLAEKFIEMYGETYSELLNNKEHILNQLQMEEDKFWKTLEHGLREMKKIWNPEKVTEGAVTEGDKAFYIYETYGFPIEMIEEELQKDGYKINKEEFRKNFAEAEKKHQDDSRAGSTQKFAGGLADNSEEVSKLHTATHLLHQALKMVLGIDVNQKGSNITAERLRFDFNCPQKMTPEQLKQVEDIVNEQIKNALPVSCENTTVEEAKKRGAVGLFENKYGDQIKLYKIGDFSMEICGGPHAANTADLKSFKIVKEEASSAGVRRIKAVIGQ